MDELKLHIHFLKSGLLVQAQDMGRFGFQDAGVPVSGALDKKAAMLANLLVGQNVNTPVLEITYAGPVIQFSSDCQIAITGADLSPSINGQEIELYSTINIRKADTLKFGRLQSGCRSYLAVRGNWKLSSWLNSVSPLLYDDYKITSANNFKKGDQIEVLKYPPISTRSIQKERIQNSKLPYSIRVLKGPDSKIFSAEEMETFTTQVYSLSNDCNRMGCRLAENLHNYKTKKEILSSAILPGTIQITHSGKPIILLADAQTTGGYPRIANIISADLDLCAQLKPGDKISFRFVDLVTARKINEKVRLKWEETLYFFKSGSIQ